MYDRKKVTLFVLLVATVVLGGLSLFLAISINNNQAPDDSEASGGTCAPRYSELASTCAVGITQMGCTPIIHQTSGSTCCDFDGTSCTSRGGAPSYCSQVSCSGLTESACVSSSNSIVINNVCTWATTSCSAPGGQQVSEGSTICNAGTSNRRYSCINGGSSAIPISQCCNNFTWNGSTCVAPVVPDPDPVDPDPVDPDPVDPDPVDPTPDPGNNTSSCTTTAPTAAKITGPGNGAVINTATVTLTWDRNGTFGVNCNGNENEFRVRMVTVGLGEACPTNASNNGPYTKVGTVAGGPNGSFTMNVADNTKYCWTVRKANGELSSNSGIRSFTVDLAEVSPTTGTDIDETTGTTSVEPDIDPTTGSTTGVSGGNLPATAIISDELDPILLGMLLIIVGLVFYKFDFVSFKSSRVEE